MHVVPLCLQCGSIAINLGTNMMKLGHNKRDVLLDIGAKPPGVHKFWQWRLGWLLFITGNIINFVSFGYAAQSLLAAIGSVQFVSNLVFAATVLKDTIPPRIVFATALIVAGDLLLVVFGSKESPEFTAWELAALYRAPGMVLYMSLAFGCALPVSWMGYRCGQSLKAKGILPKPWAKLLPVLYSIYSSVIGAQSVLFATSLSLVANQTLSGHSQMRSWFTYIIAAGMLSLSVFWINQLTQGLLLFPSSVIVPMLEIIWVLLIMLSGEAQALHWSIVQAAVRLRLRCRQHLLWRYGGFLQASARHVWYGCGHPHGGHLLSHSTRQ
eukprot:jgi/Astpho2/8946/e_gw1.00133.129.1_t